MSISPIVEIFTRGTGILPVLAAIGVERFPVPDSKRHPHGQDGRATNMDFNRTV
jgi:hypothetical protein